MTYALLVTPANGVTDTFPVSFPFLAKADVKVYVKLEGEEFDVSQLKVRDVDYTWPTTGTIKFIAGHIPVAPYQVVIKRETDLTTLVSSATSGTLTSSQLNKTLTQLLYLEQERSDDVSSLQASALVGAKGDPGASGTAGLNAWLNANKRGESYATGWLGMTTRESYVYSQGAPAEGTAPDYLTYLRGPTYAATSDTAPYPRVSFTQAVPHGLATGDRVVVSGFADAGYNGTKAVYAVVDDTTFQIDYGGAVLTNGQTGKVQAYGTVFNALDSAIRYSWPREALHANGTAASFVRNFSAVEGPLLTYPLGGVRLYAEWLWDDEVIEIVTGGTQGSFQLWVDGNLLTLTPFSASGGYPLTFHKIQLGKRKVRRMRAHLNVPLAALAGKHKSALVPLSGLRRLRVAFLSDSFGEATGAANQSLGYLHLICERQGWDLINLSVGSTGINTDGGGAFGKKKYVDRLSDLAKADADVVVVCNSINSNPLTTADCAGLFDGIIATAPHARIIGFGRVWVNEAPSAQTLADDAVFKAACAAYGIPFIDGGIGTTPGAPIWVTATNKATYYNGTQATATATVAAGGVTGGAVVNPGVGYDFFNTPLPVLSGGGGTGGALTPVWNAEVTSLQVLNGGFGYTVTPTVVLECGASAVVSRDGGTTVNSVAVTDGGGGYLVPPAVTFTGGGGTGAAGVAVIDNGRVIRVNITNTGSGYTSDPTVVFSESTTKATATAQIADGKVTGLVITSPGSFYTSIPRVRFVPDASGGQGAVAVAHCSKKLSSLTVGAAGSGYSSAPSVTIAHPTGGDVTHPKTSGHMMLAEFFGQGLEDLL
jgi:hypothetical protein